ncbi:unnamed protein product [Brachionus calyciflorus]|uniref:Uncharacterized protein n=1 Tax=Brachionus calyciflorus TaxID=104777 RepID=A0A814R493_9BILA|nr:unnamed protein product [Brachionus calyciflorus]
MIVRLIRSGSSNLKEYKQEILTGQDLPSYVRGPLYDAPGFWTNASNKLLIQSLTNGLQKSRLNTFLPQTSAQSKLSINDALSTKDEQNLYQQLSYLHMLQKSNKLNADLDHIEEELVNLEEDENENVFHKSMNIPNFSQMSSPVPLENFSNFPQNLPNTPRVDEGFKNVSPNRFTPNPYQNIANKILINIPQTPSNSYLNETNSIWPINNQKLNHRYLATLPPSTRNF